MCCQLVGGMGSSFPLHLASLRLSATLAKSDEETVSSMREINPQTQH
jgi:hypothetical protein